MNGIAVDTVAMTATIGPGAQNHEITASVVPFGVAIPSGRCPTVGVSGFTLGGGFGFSSRQLGLAADTLTAQGDGPAGLTAGELAPMVRKLLNRMFYPA